MIKNANTDLIAGVFGLLFSAVFWFSIDDEIGRLSIVFPRAIILIMALVSVILLVKGFIKAERSDLFSEGNPRRVVITCLLFFGWYFAITFLGFFVASVIAITSIVYYLAIPNRQAGLGTLGGWILIVLGEVLFFYLVFSRLLHVPLPRGFFF